MLLVGCPGLAGALDREGLEPLAFDSVGEATAEARGMRPRACVLGPHHAGPGVGGEVRALRRALPFTDVVAWSPGIGPPEVREALLAGAADVLLDPSPDAVALAIRRLVDDQKILPRVIEHEDRDATTWRFEGLASRSRRMWDVFETCIRTAGTLASVLILGETGTGKELVARAIHRRSGRSGRFVALNCGAVPESLIDSELFGHVEGAFTGAAGAKEGLFRHADGGTLFLDEIGNLPLPAQYRLLRALQESTVRPVGGHEEIPVDIRIIAATSSPIAEAVEAGRFREDLLYRIDVIRIVIPPLRERPEDIVFLFGHFAREFVEQYGLARPDVTDRFLDALLAHDWPGNVRELENYTERLLLTQPGERLGASHFDRLMQGYDTRDSQETPPPASRLPAAGEGIDTGRSLPATVGAAVERVERAWLDAALRENRGRIIATAEQAGISRRTLLRKLTAYDIDKQDYREE